MHNKFEKLVKSGILISFSIENVDIDGNIGVCTKNRNTEKLTLCFPSGETLILGTFCSGYSENSFFLVY